MEGQRIQRKSYPRLPLFDGYIRGEALAHVTRGYTRAAAGQGVDGGKWRALGDGRDAQTHDRDMHTTDGCHGRTLVINTRQWF